MRTNKKVQRVLARASFAQAFFAAQATAQDARESRDDVVRQRCVAITSGLGRTVSAENAPRLRELRDCDESSGQVLSRLWAEPLGDVAVVNALIRASSDVRDARTAAAALAVVENESRPVFERAAALAVLANYLDPRYIGFADRLGAKMTVQLASRSHVPTWIDGTNPLDPSLRTRIVALLQTLRTAQTPRELVELARVASLPGEK